MSKKKAGQAELPLKGKGVERIKIDAIDKAASTYVRLRDSRATESDREIAAKQKLIDLMEKNADKIGRDKNGAIIYRYDDEIVIVEPGKIVLKVKHVAATSGANDAK